MLNGSLALRPGICKKIFDRFPDMSVSGCNPTSISSARAACFGVDLVHGTE
jgi:hypothetical protein